MSDLYVGLHEWYICFVEMANCDFVGRNIPTGLNREGRET